MALWKIDPNGDVLLTLYNPNAPFAFWSPDEKTEENSLPKSESESGPDTASESESEPEFEPVPNPEPQPEVKWVLESDLASGSTSPLEKNPCDGSSRVIKYLVSSRHLILASKYFEKLLQGPWMEGTEVHLDGCRHVSAEDWDERALLILMQIIHGRNKKVPRVITLEMYAKIAVLVDYYKCHEVVTLWSELWTAQLRTNLPKRCDRDLVLWILIASVFQEGQLFKEATEIAVNHCDNDLPTMHLPILRVAEHINSRRQCRLREIFDFLFDIRIFSGENSIGCNFACSSMLLGALMLQMHKNGLDSKPKPPYTGYMIMSVLDMVRNFETPSWRCPHHNYKYHDGCTISELVVDNLVAGEEVGLELWEVFGVSTDD
ncbi:hypothetical protein F4806DRAFT_66736 [Annulohypoxylon nitens]|nr:hypothetical protein F4806DRAFT_66736 [Annulohypoxylon nitens]